MTTTTDPQPETCPECGQGHVVKISANPMSIQYVCSARCGWDA